jgi:hypothetical protein
MDSKRYNLAGWLAILYAILLVPQILFGLIVEWTASGHPAAETPVMLLNMAGFALVIYVLVMFRHLLNERFDFHEVDVLIWILIWANVLFVALGLVGIIPAIEDPLKIIVLALFVPYSIITAVFGFKLLRLKDDLFGLLKPYAYTTMALGILGATILLMPIALFVQIAALIIQGMIFLRAKEQTEFV